MTTSPRMEMFRGISAFPNGATMPRITMTPRVSASSKWSLRVTRAHFDESHGADVKLRVQRESGRQRCLKIDLFSRDRVLELQEVGMQEISSIAWEPGKIFKRLARWAV
jgi:hypothetical protein